MTPELKQKWIDALRSGRYAQGKERLVQHDNDTGESTYCCLGVLGNIAGLTDKQLQGEECAGANGALLSHETLEMVGLREKMQSSLAQLNDHDVSFYDISCLLEAMENL